MIPAPREPAQGAGAPVPRHPVVHGKGRKYSVHARDRTCAGWGFTYGLGRARRARGEGDVGWQEKLRVYRARLYIPKRYRHLHGGKTHLSFYAKKQEDAMAKRDASREEMKEARGGKDVALALYLSRWLEQLEASGRLSDRTLYDYRRHAERYLMPKERLGGVAVSYLTAEDLDHLYASLVREGVRVRTINHIHATATGTVPTRPNLTHRHFVPILKKAGLSKETRLYDLRHTFGTLWTEIGKRGELPQKVMGHARYETTANNYIHPSDDATKRACGASAGTCNG